MKGIENTKRDGAVKSCIKTRSRATKDAKIIDQTIIFYLLFSLVIAISSSARADAPPDTVYIESIEVSFSIIMREKQVSLNDTTKCIKTKLCTIDVDDKNSFYLDTNSDKEIIIGINHPNFTVFSNGIRSIKIKNFLVQANDSARLYRINIYEGGYDTNPQSMYDFRFRNTGDVYAVLQIILK